MGEVVRSITLKSFNPAKYPNPALQWHYRILQAIALEEELPDQPEDKTIPKYGAIHKRTGPLAFEWGELLDKDVPAGRAIGSAPGKKRKAVENGGGGETAAPVDKKVKTEKQVVPASTDKLESLYEQSNLMSVCVPVLTTY